MVGLSTQAQAAKFDLMMGSFSITATSASGETNIGALGAYRASFSKSVLDKFDILAGYTINMTNTIGGDLGYGLDVGCNFFPFTFTEVKTFERDGLTVTMDELWRPYVGISFNQRQFQSVRNSYAGFGFNLGAEYSLGKQYSLKGEARYISLGGSNDSEATETSFLAGVTLRI